MPPKDALGADFSGFMLVDEIVDYSHVNIPEEPKERDMTVQIALATYPGVVDSILSKWRYPEDFHNCMEVLKDRIDIVERISALWGHPQEFNTYMENLNINSLMRYDRQGFPGGIGGMLMRLANMHHDLYPEAKDQKEVTVAFSNTRSERHIR